MYSLVQLHIQDECSSKSVDLKAGVGQVVDLGRARPRQGSFMLKQNAAVLTQSFINPIDMQQSILICIDNLPRLK